MIGASLMLSAVMQANGDTHPQPCPLPLQQGDEGPIARNSHAIRRASDGEARRQCRAVTRRRRSDRGGRALRPAGLPADEGLRAAASRDRRLAGRSRRRGRDPRDCDRDGDRARTACRAWARARREPTAATRACRGVEQGCGCPLLSGGGSRDRPRWKDGRADHPASSPKALDARRSARACRATAARRPAELAWQACQDRPGNPRPQGDHLLGRRGCGISVGVPVVRWIASWAKAEARRTDASAEAQAARNSGLRRSHSQANQRASNVKRAR